MFISTIRKTFCSASAQLAGSKLSGTVFRCREIARNRNENELCSWAAGFRLAAPSGVGWITLSCLLAVPVHC